MGARPPSAGGWRYRPVHLGAAGGVGGAAGAARSRPARLVRGVRRGPRRACAARPPREPRPCLGVAHRPGERPPRRPGAGDRAGHRAAGSAAHPTRSRVDVARRRPALAARGAPRPCRCPRHLDVRRRTGRGDAEPCRAARPGLPGARLDRLSGGVGGARWGVRHRRSHAADADRDPPADPDAGDLVPRGRPSNRVGGRLGCAGRGGRDRASGTPPRRIRPR